MYCIYWMEYGAPALSMDQLHALYCAASQDAGTSMQPVNLTTTDTAEVTWAYAPQPALEVTLVPADGCPDGTTTCLLANKHCHAGGDTLVRPVSTACLAHAQREHAVHADCQRV